MFVLIMPFSGNALGKTAALFEHSLVVCLGASLQKSLGANCIDLYPEPGEGEVLMLTRQVTEEEARECAEKAGADLYLRGNLHYRPQGSPLLEGVTVRVLIGRGDVRDREGRAEHRFSGFLKRAESGQLLDISALQGLVRELTLEIADFLEYPRETLDLTGVEEGITLNPVAWAEFITALRLVPGGGSKKKHYLRAIGLDPGFAVAYLNLARVLIGQSRHREALDLLHDGLRHLRGDPSESDLVNLMAFCYLMEGHVRRALEMWGRLTEEEPARAEPWYNMGNVYHSMGMPEKALELYQRAVEADGLFPLARFALGRLYAEMGEHEASARELSVYIRLVPGDPWAYSILGHCLLEIGERERARFALKKALQLDPDGEAGKRAREDLRRL